MTSFNERRGASSSEGGGEFEFQVVRTRALQADASPEPAEGEAPEGVDLKSEFNAELALDMEYLTDDIEEVTRQVPSIGAEVARQASSAGAYVVLCARRQAELNAVVEQCGGAVRAGAVRAAAVAYARPFCLWPLRCTARARVPFLPLCRCALSTPAPAAGAPPNLLNGVLTTLELSLSSSSTSVQTPDLGRGYRPLSEAPCEKARNFGSIKTRSGPGVPPHAESG